MLFCPVSESCRSACFVHKANHNSQDNEEDENTDIPAVRKLGYHSILQNMLEEYSERSSGVDGSTDKDTDEQGGINLLGYKSQGDGDNRWKNRNKAKDETSFLVIFIFCINFLYIFHRCSSFQTRI